MIQQVPANEVIQLPAGPAGSQQTLTVISGGAVYYGDSGVSSTHYAGVAVVGTPVTIDNRGWYLYSPLGAITDIEQGVKGESSWSAQIAQLQAQIASMQSQMNQFRGGWLGINGNVVTGYGPRNMWTQLGFTWERLNVQQGTTTAAQILASIADALSQGVTNVVVEIQETGYGQGGAFPSNAGVIAGYAAYFVSIIQTIEATYPGICVYEVINEPWNFYSGGQATAQTYADLLVVVLAACQTADIDLTKVFPMVKDQTWPQAMITRQPTLQNLIKGWSLHPYGAPPPSNINATSQDLASLPDFGRLLASQGLPAPRRWLVSEIGFRDYTISASGAGSSVVALTALQAVQWTLQTLRFARNLYLSGSLVALLWYSRNDAGPGWSLNSAGGALTNVGTAFASFGMDEDLTNSNYDPADDGYYAVTGDPWMFADTAPLNTSGRTHWWRVSLKQEKFCTTIGMYMVTAGGTPTNSFVGVYDALGNLVAQTTDVSSTISGSTGKVTFTLNRDASNNVITGIRLKPGVYYLAILVNWVTTAPAFRGRLSVDQGWAGGGSAIPTRQMMANSGTASALPTAVTFNGSATRLSFGMWMSIGT